MYTIHAPLT